MAVAYAGVVACCPKDSTYSGLHWVVKKETEYQDQEWVILYWDCNERCWKSGLKSDPGERIDTTDMEYKCPVVRA